MESQEKYKNHFEEMIGRKMENRQERKDNKRGILGMIFIVIGTVLIAQRMGFIPSSISHIILSWQMLLIAIGAFSIFTKANYRSGLILISIGAFFMVPKLIDIPFETREMFWPAIFIVIGILMVTVKNRHKGLEGNDSSEHSIDMLTLFGGGKRKITSDQFVGGKVTSIFGGSEIDLTGAKLKEGTCVIDVFTMFGGSEVAVPRDWDVHVDVVSIFGGFEDKRGPVDLEAKNGKQVLIVKGFSIFGGGEVKSY